MSTQLNVRIPDELIEALDRAAKAGRYKNRSEAVKDAVRMFVRRYEMGAIGKKIKVLAERNASKYNAKEAVIRAHEDEE